MRTFRAISIAEAFREQLTKVEDHSTYEHNIACRPLMSCFYWLQALHHNHPHMPCPGNLWPFS